MLDANRVRAVWSMNDYVTWEPDSRVHKNVPISGMYGIPGYGLYEEEYLRTSAGWRISFSRLIRTRIDPLAGNPSPDPAYEFPAPDATWLEGRSCRAHGLVLQHITIRTLRTHRRLSRMENL